MPRRLIPAGPRLLVLGTLALAAPPGTDAQERMVLQEETGSRGPAPSAGTTRDSVGDRDADDLPFTMRIGGRLQLRFLHESEEGTSTVHVRRGRLALSGKAYEHFDYTLQLELSGGSAALIDANVRVALSPLAVLWFGQGKPYFGRQQITSSSALQFVDRTLVDDRFSAKRQQGIGLMGRAASDRLEYNLGVYNGDGINRSVNRNRRFMKAARLVLTPLGSYPPVESAHDDPGGPRVAMGVSGLRNTEGEAPDELRVTRLNSEVAVRVGGLNATGELYREWADPKQEDEQVTDGWYVQLGYLLPGRRHEVAGRVAEIRPDAPGDRGLTEAGVVYNHYLRGHAAKVQTDLRSLRDRTARRTRGELRVQLQLSL